MDAAKTLLLRWGYSQDFETMSLKVRELGFAIDTDELLIGTSKGNQTIPNENKVSLMIKEKLDSFKIKKGGKTYISDNIVPGEMVFNIDIHRIQFIDPVNVKTHTLATKSDLIAKEATTVKIADSDIDHDDDDSVTFTDFYRPNVLVFLNGVLVTSHDDDPHKYTYNAKEATIKITNCSEDDLISFF